MMCLKDRAFQGGLGVETSAREQSRGCTVQASFFQQLRWTILPVCADERTQFGAALGSFQLVQEKLARMLANLQAMFLMCWRLSKLYEEVWVLVLTCRRFLCSLYCKRCRKVIYMLFYRLVP